jgi:hypothetical protein
MPVPFILRVPFGRAWRGELQAGQSVEFELVLIGKANLDLPYYVLALSELGRAGLGPTRHKLRLEEVAAWTSDGFVPVYQGEGSTIRTDVGPFPLQQVLTEFGVPDGSRLVIRFASPVRLDLRGDLVYPVEFTDLLQSLAQRSQALSACYGSAPIPHAPLDRARAARRAVDRTRWVDLARYSTRQRAHMRIGGAVGTVTYEGADFSAFASLLGFGEWLGVGKLTSMGFGRMEVVRG